MYEPAVTDGRILIVGEVPSRGDYNAGKPFTGMTGKDLDLMLHEAGILRSDCHITFVAQRPIPGYETKRFFAKYTKAFQTPTEEIRLGVAQLHLLIRDLTPNLIISLGELALWALTGESGITKWRGSILSTIAPNQTESYPTYKVIPTYSPDVVSRKYDWRFIAVQDFRRAEKESHFPDVRIPSYDFIIRPSFEKTMETLDGLLRKADELGAEKGASVGSTK